MKFLRLAFHLQSLTKVGQGFALHILLASLLILVAYFLADVLNLEHENLDVFQLLTLLSFQFDRIRFYFLQRLDQSDTHIRFLLLDQ